MNEYIVTYSVRTPIRGIVVERTESVEAPNGEEALKVFRWRHPGDSITVLEIEMEEDFSDDEGDF